MLNKYLSNEKGKLKPTYFNIIPAGLLKGPLGKEQLSQVQELDGKS